VRSVDVDSAGPGGLSSYLPPPVLFRARHALSRRLWRVTPDAPKTHHPPSGWVAFPNVAIFGAGPLNPAALAWRAPTHGTSALHSFGVAHGGNLHNATAPL